MVKLQTNKYIGAIDQGTTSSRFIIFNHKGDIVCSTQIEHKQYYPNPGWVEQDPTEILENTKKAINKTLSKASISVNELVSIGITNQRETVTIWDKHTGKPLYNAIVWQDTRTAELCEKLDNKYGKNFFREKTGLPPATYFSGSKIKWLIDNNSDVKSALRNDNALIGTMDSWLLWNLTKHVHATDVTNAGRTLLYNIRDFDWDDELLDIFSVPRSALPEVKPSITPKGYGKLVWKGKETSVMINTVLGDQQAALFGQNCYIKGEAKSTYGTGAFLLMNIGHDFYLSENGLLTTPAYSIEDKEPVYALEGSIALAGSLVQWFRDNIGLIKQSADIETLASKASDNGGVYCVPAFSGLFAPYWNSNAQGLITGITHYSNSSHLARAVLEATAYQTYDVFKAMEADTGIELKQLKVDGGMTVNSLLMQFLSDILECEVIKPKISETTCLGAAFGSGLASGFWSKEELLLIQKRDIAWEPKGSKKEIDRLVNGWQRAIRKSITV